jgi:hypothetical protein
MGVDLRAQLISQATPDAPIKKILHAGQHWLIGKTPGVVDDAAKAFRRKHAETATDHQMQADVQARMLESERHRLVTRRPSDHQAGGGKYAVAKRANYGSIDFA